MGSSGGHKKKLLALIEDPVETVTQQKQKSCTPGKKTMMPPSPGAEDKSAGLGLLPKKLKGHPGILSYH
jgi:hypothetical protein